jgi:hypothetical protein
MPRLFRFDLSLWSFRANSFRPGIVADLPLCFANFVSIAVVFVPNSFLCVVDPAQPPPDIDFLPKQSAAAAALSRRNAATVPEFGGSCGFATGLMPVMNMAITNSDNRKIIQPLSDSDLCEPQNAS